MSERPWLGLYAPGVPADLEPPHTDALSMFRSAARRHPDAPLIHYFDATLSVAAVDRASDALAAGLRQLGVDRGDRVAVQLQNVPQFVLAVLATWKVAGTVVPTNPMLKAAELRTILADSAARVLVTHDDLLPEVDRGALDGTDVGQVVTTSAADLLDGAPPALLDGPIRPRPSGTADLLRLVERHDGERPAPAPLGPEDVAYLTYTSGTTGPPKGAMNTHRNVVFNAEVYRAWTGVGRDDVVLGAAPLFHITGLVAHIAVSLLVPAPLVLTHRFHAPTVAAATERHRATFTVAAITAYIALMNDEEARRHDLSSLVRAYSGGAPIPPATVAAYERDHGVYIRNAYGLTETTSPSHLVPRTRRAPVDEEHGALAVGVPVSGTDARVVGPDGEVLPPGELGEIAVRGPQVVPGYWQRPDETAAAIRDGWLHTGDVGFRDRDGWFYVVDRLKDQINAAGFKVWPREVEDVLYAHPAVLEAAVVGVPDAYRGETVKAFVSLRPGRRATAEELVAFCRQRMAAYKYPRLVEFVDELPKTPTGKVLRRELRR